VTFPDHIKSHTRQQTLCFGPDGLLRRHDFTIDLLGAVPSQLDATDYRDVDGTYDAICSVEMLEAVGERYWDTYFAAPAQQLAPGGRVALLSSLNRGPLPAAITRPLVRSLTGVRLFDRNELTRALTARGLIDVQQRVSGLAQFVAARKPAT